MKNFKKYIMILAAAPMLWACSADEGTEPGNDPNPVVTLYTYAPSATDETLNADNDVIVRFVTNNKATSVKYLLLPTADAQNTIKNGGDAALLAKVEKEGTALQDIKANSYADVTLTDIHGDYTIAAVANGSNLAGSVKFLGLEWETIKEGTFVYGAVGSQYAPAARVEAALEICTTDETLYHIKNAFGEGKNLNMHMLEDKGYDEDGNEYQMFRVSLTNTFMSAEEGRIFVRDFAYAYNYPAYATTAGTCCELYEDGYTLFRLQWLVPGVKSLGLAASAFVPND